MNLQQLYTVFQGLAALFILYTVLPGSQLQTYNPHTPQTTFPPYYTPSATHDIDDTFLKRTDIWLDFDTIGKITGIHKHGIVPATPSNITPSRPRTSALGMNVLYSDLQKSSPQSFTRNFQGKNFSAISNSGIIIALTSIIGIFIGIITPFVGKPVSGNPNKKAPTSSNITYNSGNLNVPTRFGVEVASLSPVVDTVESQRPSPFGTPPIISGVSHALSPFALPSPLTTTPCAKYDAKLAIIAVTPCDLVKPTSPLDLNGPIIAGPTTNLLPSLKIDGSVRRLNRHVNSRSPVKSASRIIQGSKVISSTRKSSASPATRSSYSQGTPLSSLGDNSTDLTPETQSIQSMHAWYDRFDEKLDSIQASMQASSKIHDDFEAQLELSELKKEKDMARLDSLLDSFMKDEDYTRPGITSDGEMKARLLVTPQRLSSYSASEREVEREMALNKSEDIRHIKPHVAIRIEKDVETSPKISPASDHSYMQLSELPCSSSFPPLLVFDSSEFLATSSAMNLNSLAVDDGLSDLTDSKAHLPEYTPQGTPEIRRLLAKNVPRLLDVTFEYSLGEGEDEGEMFDKPIVKTSPPVWLKDLTPPDPLPPQPDSPPQAYDSDDEWDSYELDDEVGDDGDILNLEELDRRLPGLDPLSDSDDEY